MPKLGTERGSVQDPMLQYACEIGWEYIKPDETERLRGGRTGLLLRETFSNQMLKLNSGFLTPPLIEELIKNIERLPVSIAGNLEAWEYLKGIRTVFVPEEKRERNVKLIDKSPEHNTFHVTDEFSFTNGTHTNRYDVVFLINGIPVFFVEAKSAHKINGISEALDQVGRYHKETPEAMTIFQVYTLTHLIHFYYSATWNHSVKSLFSWKDESGGREYEELVKDFFDRKRVINTALDHILFTRKDEEIQKVILRPHQIRAVKKLVERASSKKKKRGLVWHTQGSGKTYTMIVAAEKIIENPLFENPTVIMLVDRNELEQQLFGNLTSVGFEYVNIAESKRHLMKLLKQDTRGLIVTTIHKFEGMPEGVNTRSNVFILVDEAHRTTGGDLGNYLTGALPNSSMFGFTGTPIDKTSYGKGTFVTFGRDDEPQGYLDKYSISESIEDGATVKLHYSLASNELLPDRETLEREFLDLKEAEGVSDIEALNKILEKAVNLQNMLKNRQRIKDVTEHIVEHYRDYVEPLGYKAFIVAVDREACALYKEELDKHLPAGYSKAVYSSSANDYEKSPLLTKHFLVKEQEKVVRKAFLRTEQNPKILIVTEKLLTGYDAPILYCMYLDKPMRDHVLLQAIARVNRPYEDEKGIQKPCGFVLDFVGIFDKLEKALAFDSKDISEVIKDVQLLKDSFAGKMEVARSDYLAMLAGKNGDKATEAVLKHFAEEDLRNDFYRFYSELADMYEIISPDAFLRPFLEDYDTLSRMVRILKASYEPGLLVDKEFARKTARLVQEHTTAGKIKTELDIYEIDENTTKKLEDSTASDTEKIFNLLKSIEREVSKEIKNNPYLLSIGEKADNIAENFKQRQLNTQDALLSLKELIDDMNSSKKERLAKDMPTDVYSVYWYLKREGVEGAEDIGREIGATLNEYPHWKESEMQEREVRQELYRVMINKSGLDPGKVVEKGEKLITILKEPAK